MWITDTLPCWLTAWHSPGKTLPLTDTTSHYTVSCYITLHHTIPYSNIYFIVVIGSDMRWIANHAQLLSLDVSTLHYATLLWDLKLYLLRQLIFLCPQLPSLLLIRFVQWLIVSFNGISYCSYLVLSYLVCSIFLTVLSLPFRSSWLYFLECCVPHISLTIHLLLYSSIYLPIYLLGF